MYSKLNSIWESWLGILTDNVPEAIVNNIQKAKLVIYQLLMERSFMEFYRLLKPSRWMTVEFHNSQTQSGRPFRKPCSGQTLWWPMCARWINSRAHSNKSPPPTVKQDLIISAYKPEHSFEQRFMAEGGSAAGAWAASCNSTWNNCPCRRCAAELLEPQSERLPYLLYDRMVAFHIMRGLPVPLSAPQFYQGLGQLPAA